MTAAAAPASRTELTVAVVALAVGAAGLALATGAWLGLYIGPIPFPVTILVALAYGLWLVRIARSWSDSLAFLLVPPTIFALTVLAVDLGPGGDTPVPMDLRGLGLLLAGGVVPAWSAMLGRLNSLTAGART